MIDQFIASADGQLMGDDKTARRILDQFLNHFMLKNKMALRQVVLIRKYESSPIKLV